MFSSEAANVGKASVQPAAGSALHHSPSEPGATGKSSAGGMPSARAQRTVPSTVRLFASRPSAQRMASESLRKVIRSAYSTQAFSASGDMPKRKTRRSSSAFRRVSSPC